MPIEDVIVRIRGEFTQFNKAMANPMSRFKKMINEVGRLDMRFKENQSILGRVANRFRFLTHGLRGFRMEMLGVMFFGLGITRWMKGLLQPALDLVGVFDLMNLTLAIGFLPNALTLNNVMLELMKGFLGLPEPMREFIGWMILAGYGAGQVLFNVGMLALGLGSLTLAWGTFTAVVLPFLVTVGAIIIAVGLIITLWKNWEKISVSTKIAIAGLLTVVGLLLLLFFPVAGTILLIAAAIIGLIAVFKNWGAITDWFKDKWTDLKNFLVPLVNWMIDWLINPFIKGLNVIQKFRGKTPIEELKHVVRMEEPVKQIQKTYTQPYGPLGPKIPTTYGEGVKTTTQTNNFDIDIQTTGTFSQTDMDKLKAQLDEMQKSALQQIARSG